MCARCVFVLSSSSISKQEKRYSKEDSRQRSGTLDSLSIDPDNWTDNHRRISYMGTTAYFSDRELTSLSNLCRIKRRLSIFTT